MTDQSHTIVAMNDVGDTVKEIETFEDWGLAIVECGLLNEHMPDPCIAAYEVVTTNQ